MTTLLAEAQDGPVDILIRSARNRNLEEDDKLWEHMNSLPSQGEMTFEMPSGPGRSARTVIQQVRFDTITLKPSSANHAKLPEIIVTAVFAREENPPAGEDPIEWLLFTTKTVTTLAQAIVIISWYRCRWEIEVYFRTLKTGFRVERLQLETADRLKPAIALFLITTWRIVYLTKLGRVNPDVPATVAFTEQECEVASRLTKRRETKRLPSLFVGRKRSLLKVLMWDVSGFWLAAKRLERGTFAVRGRVVEDRTVSGSHALSLAEMMNLLEGIDVRHAMYHQHYQPLHPDMDTGKSTMAHDSTAPTP